MAASIANRITETKPLHSSPYLKGEEERAETLMSQAMRKHTRSSRNAISISTSVHFLSLSSHLAFCGWQEVASISHQVALSFHLKFSSLTRISRVGHHR